MRTSNAFIENRVFTSIVSTVVISDTNLRTSGDAAFSASRVTSIRKETASVILSHVRIREKTKTHVACDTV